MKKTNARRSSAENISLDDLDIRILNILEENGRLSYRNIAKRIGVSVSTIMNHVNALEKSGLIKQYSAKIDYEKIGYDVTAIIDMRISKGKLFEVEKKIAVHPNVFGVYDTTGSFDATILVRFRKRSDLDKFLKSIQLYEFVERTETKLVLNVIKEGSIKI